MKIKYYKGAIAGGVIGFIVWLASAFVGLPAFIFYMSQLWIVRPIVKAFELGASAAMITMVLASVISFAIYGILLNMLYEKIRSKRE